MPIEQENGLATKPVWTFCRRQKSPSSAEIRTPDRPSRSLVAKRTVHTHSFTPTILRSLVHAISYRWADWCLLSDPCRRAWQLCVRQPAVVWCPAEPLLWRRSGHTLDASPHTPPSPAASCAESFDLCFRYCSYLILSVFTVDYHEHASETSVWLHGTLRVWYYDCLLCVASHCVYVKSDIVDRKCILPGESDFSSSITPASHEGSVHHYQISQNRLAVRQVLE